MKKYKKILKKIVCYLTKLVKEFSLAKNYKQCVEFCPTY